MQQQTASKHSPIPPPLSSLPSLLGINTSSWILLQHNNMYIVRINFWQSSMSQYLTFLLKTQNKNDTCTPLASRNGSWAGSLYFFFFLPSGELIVRSVNEVVMNYNLGAVIAGGAVVWCRCGSSREKDLERKDAIDWLVTNILVKWTNIASSTSAFIYWNPTELLLTCAVFLFLHSSPCELAKKPYGIHGSNNSLHDIQYSTASTCILPSCWVGCTYHSNTCRVFQLT